MSGIWGTPATPRIAKVAAAVGAAKDLVKSAKWHRDVIRAHAGSLAHAKTAHRPGPLQPKHGLAAILVVDDNEAAIDLARIMLIEQSKLRSRILSARSGREAIEMLRDVSDTVSPVDLVLLDINMPLMDGFEVLAKFAKVSDPGPSRHHVLDVELRQRQGTCEGVGCARLFGKAAATAPSAAHLQSIQGLGMETRPGGHVLLRVA